MKKIILNIVCAVLIIATAGIFIWGRLHAANENDKNYDDGVTQIDLNKIYLKNSGVEVEFSDVILSGLEESRKLIISEQTGTVSTELTDKVIKKLDFDFLKKTQKVSYTGKGYFVVDLDNLTKDSIIQDKQNKTVTIRIDHAYLKAIEINPNDIIIDEVKEGLLARGNIELTVQDYTIIEKELRAKLESQFDTAENGQAADVLALKMVREVYEPVIKAVDNRYSVIVEFR